MILRRLVVRRIPGLNKRLDVVFDDHVTIVHGPNASGKSTIARAIRALVFADEDASAGRAFDAWAEFGDGDVSLRAERDGSGASRWTSEGGTRSRPDLPSSTYAPCYFLRAVDLLAPRENGELEAALRRMLQGGQDLTAIEREFFAERPRVGSQEARTVATARRELRRERLAMQALAERDDRREELEAHFAELEGAAAEKAAIELSIEYAASTIENERLERQRASLPDGAFLLDGSERERLSAIDADIDDAEAALCDARERLARLAREQDGCGRAIPIEEERARRIGESLTRLERLHDEFLRARRVHRIEADRHERVLHAQRIRVETKGRRKPGSVPVVSEAMFDAIERQFQKELERAARAKVLAAEEDALTRRKPPQSLRVSKLVWLAAGLGVALTACGASLVARGLQPGWLLVAGGAVAVVLAIYWRREPQRALRLEFDSRLDHDRERLEIRRERLDVIRDQHRAKRSKLEERLGFALPRGAAASLELARSRERLHASSQRVAACRDATKVARATFDEEFDAFAALVTEVGIDITGELEVDSSHVLEELSTSQRLGNVLRERERAAADENAALARKRQLEERAAALLRSRRFRPDADGRERLEAAAARLDEARDLALRVDRVRTRRSELRERLRDDQVYGKRLLELDVDEARALLVVAEERVRERDRVLARLVELRHEVATAKKGTRFALARSRVDEAQEALENVFTKQLDASAGRILLARVRHRLDSDVDSDQRPPVVVQASRLFAYFTHERYELLVREDAGSLRILARDVEAGEVRDLDLLSDGTRSQLLLAWHLAIAFVTERSGKFTIFLDEVFAHSDDERFDAIAENVLRLAVREERQFVVMTADTADIARLERTACRLRAEGEHVHAPAVVDLGMLDEQRPMAPVALPAMPPRPSFEGAAAWSASDWAERLRPAAVDPWRDPGSLHLFHLFPRVDRDHTALFVKLMGAKLTTIASWEALRRRGFPSWLDDAEGAVVDHAVRVAKSWMRAWRIGRGRALLDEDVRELEALPTRLTELAVTLARNVDGDAARFVAAAREGALPRLQKKRIAALHDELVLEEFLDTRAPLDAAARRARVLIETDDGDASSAESAAEIVDRLEAAVRSDPAVVIPRTNERDKERRVPDARA
ncbi:MAG: AAA family ATPase [Planctomycetes bacterium]|nr:AAA family ATPase [Planctomycetota bacterium]